MFYKANPERYQKMTYQRVGKSGLKLPSLSLGLWQNFGDSSPFANQKDIVLAAFDNGITHFDLANNYGPPAGAAETNFGKIFKESLSSYRDEIIVSSKAGYYMWEGPYGEWGSRKQVISSCDQSLQRLGLNYVDIFYHHRPDLETPLEETAYALDSLVRQGKALYIGISNYDYKRTLAIAKIFDELKTPFIIHQCRYNMLDRTPEENLFDTLDNLGLGAITYSPLAQGLLTDKYLNGIPEDSRASKNDIPFLTEEKVEQTIVKVKQLNELAQSRNQTLAQMALAWNLQRKAVASVIIGCSKISQLEDNLKALSNASFSNDEFHAIASILEN